MNYEKIGDNSLPSMLAPSKDGRLSHQCPVCRGWRPSFVILKVTGMATHDHDWACDQCWVPWRRNKEAIRAGETYSCSEEWFANFVEDIGGVASEVAKLKSEARNEMAVIKAGKGVEKAATSNPAKIAELELEIEDIDERLTGTRGRVT
jgi:hypothetical protein